jgi:hypothetical protein
VGKPFRIGAGSRPDSHGPEKDAEALDFHDLSSPPDPAATIRIEHAGDHLDVIADPDGTPVKIGEIPGGGGGGPSAARFTVGAVDGNGPILPTNVVYWAQVERDVTLSGNWTLMVSPSSSVTIDIRLANFPTIPGPGDSITGGNAPAVVADSDATGDYTGWTTTTLTRGQVIAAVITANTGCRYIDLMLESS